MFSSAMLLKTLGLFKFGPSIQQDKITESDLQTVSSAGAAAPKPDSSLNLILRPNLNNKLRLLLQKLLNNNPEAIQELTFLLRENQLTLNQIKELSVTLTEHAAKGLTIAQETLSEIINIVPAATRNMIHKTIEDVCQRRAQSLEMNYQPRCRPSPF
jgi:hypothetical protein